MSALDIPTREGLTDLVHGFYADVRADAQLGPAVAERMIAQRVDGIVIANAVHDDPLAGAEQLTESAVDALEVPRQLLRRRIGPVHPGDAHLVVVVEVVRCG